MTKIRRGKLAAYEIQWGDVLVHPPGEDGVIGTVLENIRHQDCRRSFRARTPQGEIVETKPVAEERAVWLHVPAGSA